MGFKQGGFDAGEGTGSSRKEVRQEKRAARVSERGAAKANRVSARTEKRVSKINTRAEKVGVKGAEKVAKVVTKSTAKAEKISPTKVAKKKVDTSSSDPKVNVTKKALPNIKEPSFGEAFKAARKSKGSGKTFTYKGKSYSTNTADDIKSGKSKKAGTQGPVKQNKAKKSQGPMK